jgi:hypothetical protein
MTKQGRMGRKAVTWEQCWWGFKFRTSKRKETWHMYIQEPSEE